MGGEGGCATDFADREGGRKPGQRGPENTKVAFRESPPRSGDLEVPGRRRRRVHPTDRRILWTLTFARSVCLQPACSRPTVGFGDEADENWLSRGIPVDYANGFTTATPEAVKSCEFRVATTRPCASAVAAIRLSNTGRVCSAISRPHLSEMASVTGRISREYSAWIRLNHCSTAGH